MSLGSQPPLSVNPPLAPFAAPNNLSNSTFSPRREFISHQHQVSTFSLLALSGTASVRLYSFPLVVVQGLRAYFHNASLLLSFKEDSANNLCQFTLEGRPWALSKNVKTEKLIVDIIALILRHGFNFLSTIDYGREQDDKIALSFSRPVGYSRSDSPPFANGLRPNSAGQGSASGSPPVPRAPRVPFAISFSSSTVLRVINPPLNSTPAILQAVRGAWPRGVVAEKKIADTCFEFKLKGYKWFQEDTFATDSLQHILSLLSALDAHGFTLLASLTLTNRSRIKDLWVFTGTVQDAGLPDSPPQSPTGSSLELHRHQTSETAGGSGIIRHTRSATAPSPSTGGPSTPNHSQLRGATEGLGTPNESRSHHGLSPLSQSYSNNSSHSTRSLLRKPAPKPPAFGPRPATTVAAAPVAPPAPAAPPVPGPSEPVRTSLPSEVGSAVDMTGVGTGRVYRDEVDVIYEAEGEDPYEDGQPDFGGSDPFHRAPPGGYGSEEDDYHNHPPSRNIPSPERYTPSHGRRTPADKRRSPSPQPTTGTGRTHHPSQLLGGAFRDTAYTAGTGWRSTNTGWRSTEIPIAWGSSGPHDSGVGIPQSDIDDVTPRAIGPGVGTIFPGGFDPYAINKNAGALPSANVPADVTGSTLHTLSFSTAPPSSGYFAQPPGGPWPESPHTSRHTSPERHAVGAMVSNPAVMSAPSFARKSETGIVGVIPSLIAAPRPRPRRSFDSPRGWEAREQHDYHSQEQPPHLQQQRQMSGRAGSSDGWVLVDISGKATAPRPPGRTRSTSDPTRGSYGAQLGLMNAGQGYLPRAQPPPTSYKPNGLPPQAMEAANAVPVNRSGGQRRSSVKRLFSLSRRDQQDGGRRAPPAGEIITQDASDPYAHRRWHRKAPAGPQPTHQRGPEQVRMSIN